MRMLRAAVGMFAVVAIIAATSACCATSHALALASQDPVGLEGAWVDDAGGAHAAVRWDGGSTHVFTVTKDSRVGVGRFVPRDGAWTGDSSMGRPVAATLVRRWRGGGRDGLLRTKAVHVSLESVGSFECPAPASPGGTALAVLLTPPALVVDVALSPITFLETMFQAGFGRRPTMLFCAGLDDETIGSTADERLPNPAPHPDAAPIPPKSSPQREGNVPPARRS